ncbi:sentrin-specific protease 8 [Plakobranchus ocellatus]|uniref:Sentrin-specific protease 8 n=1 Tax=Plakobranchus ocellatus TaxID=259542 RepID=A0AAV3XVK5_9GAST|nr:sentrin-specific protease 8 [Plakobranchus ocellatus]
MADKDPIVLNFGDSLLLKSDLELLTEPNWINDKLIGFAYEYYEREQFNHSADRLALLSPSLVQIIRFAEAGDLHVLLESLSLPAKQFVFVPVNDNADTSRVGGTHWSLLVYVRSKQEFQHYDSASGNNQAVAKRLMDKLQPFVQAPKGKLKFVEMDCPQQENCYDCGMFLLANTEHLIREFVECVSLGVRDVVSQNSVQDKRRELTRLISSLAKEAKDHQEHDSSNVATDDLSSKHKGQEQKQPVVATS